LIKIILKSILFNQYGESIHRYIFIAQFFKFRELKDYPTTYFGGLLPLRENKSLSCNYLHGKEPICTVKALPCDAARQMSHGNAIDGKDFFAVRLANVARQRLCRATPYGKDRFFAVCQTCFI
jgi:hypothetical protein